jgi:hypothetical protein
MQLIELQPTVRELREFRQSSWFSSASRSHSPTVRQMRIGILDPTSQVSLHSTFSPSAV